MGEGENNTSKLLMSMMLLGAMARKHNRGEASYLDQNPDDFELEPDNGEESEDE